MLLIVYVDLYMLESVLKYRGPKLGHPLREWVIYFSMIITGFMAEWTNWFGRVTWSPG